MRGRIIHWLDSNPVVPGRPDRLDRQ